MSAPSIRPGRGRGRGVLGLTSFAPCPRPSALTVETHATKPVNVVKPMQPEESAKIFSHVSTSKFAPNGHVSNGVAPNGHVSAKSQIDTGPVKLLAKYKYAANPKEPGGFKELTIIQGEKLVLLQKGHVPTKNYLWWKVMNEQGQCGFVPANYCLVVEEKVTTLPWLENKSLMEEKEKREREKQAEDSGKKTGFGQSETPQVKAYVSSYGPDKTKSSQNADELAKKYYCDICFKNLNGPQPYKMHMVSKAHKEEVQRLNAR